MLISPGRSRKPSICLERRHPGRPDKLREDVRWRATAIVMIQAAGVFPIPALPRIIKPNEDIKGKIIGIILLRKVMFKSWRSRGKNYGSACEFPVSLLAHALSTTCGCGQEGLSLYAFTCQRWSLDVSKSFLQNTSPKINAFQLILRRRGTQQSKNFAVGSTTSTSTFRWRTPRMSNTSGPSFRFVIAHPLCMAGWTSHQHLVGEPAAHGTMIPMNLMGPLTGLCIGPLPALLRLSTCRRPCIIHNSSFCCSWTCVTTWRKPWRRWTEKNDDPNELRGRMRVGKSEMHKGSWDITVRITFASSAEMLGTLWKNSLKAFFPCRGACLRDRFSKVNLPSDTSHTARCPGTEWRRG